jgi:hypothetical protein
MRLAFSRPSPAMIVSVVALVVALGGTSYAVSALPSNSVGGKQLKKGAVTNKKIKSSAVTSDKVKDGTLLSKDFKAGQVPAGPAGPQGATGATGPSGVVASTIVRRIDHVLADGQSTAADQGNIQCEPGEKPIGGGSNMVPIDHGDGKFTGSGPRSGTLAAPTVPASGDAWTIWRGTASNPAGGDATALTVRVYIICAPA